MSTVWNDRPNKECFLYIVAYYDKYLMRDAIKLGNEGNYLKALKESAGKDMYESEDGVVQCFIPRAWLVCFPWLKSNFEIFTRADIERRKLGYNDEMTIAYYSRVAKRYKRAHKEEMKLKNA